MSEEYSSLATISQWGQNFVNFPELQSHVTARSKENNLLLCLPGGVGHSVIPLCLSIPVAYLFCMCVFFFLLILIIVNSETCKKRWKLRQSARTKATCAVCTQGMTGHLAGSSVSGTAGAWGWGAVFSGMPPRFPCDLGSG